jgi:hypothetical protein
LPDNSAFEPANLNGLHLSSATFGLELEQHDCRHSAEKGDLPDAAPRRPQLFRSRSRLSAVAGSAIAALGRERACHLVARQVVAAEELDMRRAGLIWMKERRHCPDAGAGLLPVLG